MGAYKTLNDERAKAGLPPFFPRPRPERRRPLEARFWEKVDKSGGNDACWAWAGRLDYYGYGQLDIDGKQERAHRLSWKLLVGDIPEDLWVLHKCDNPRCVNPSHLFLGDQKANVADMMAKGRHVKRGEKRRRLANQEAGNVSL